MLNVLAESSHSYMLKCNCLTITSKSLSFWRDHTFIKTEVLSTSKTCIPSKAKRFSVTLELVQLEDCPLYMESPAVHKRRQYQKT